MFLSSEKGRRILNFCYSWGASVVILGTMFKLLHLPVGDVMLGIGLVTEFLVFFIYGFEKPGGDYHWENVFPVLKSRNPLDEDGQDEDAPEGFFPSSVPFAPASGFHGTANITGDQSGGGGDVTLGSLGLKSPIDITEEDTKNLSDSIRKLSDAAGQISKMAELTDATQEYLNRLSGMSDNMERFSQTTHSLNEVSDTLLASFRYITDNSDGINENSRGYIRQMESLNRNVSGLNTIYEIQLKSISSQIDAIERINGGLNRIREMYDGSVVDSSVFRNETEKMTRQLAELNAVYSRLLQAMTVNMPPQTPYRHG
jgi:gliding motility-associated protein GldL